MSDDTHRHHPAAHKGWVVEPPYFAGFMAGATGTRFPTAQREWLARIGRENYTGSLGVEYTSGYADGVNALVKVKRAKREGES